MQNTSPNLESRQRGARGFSLVELLVAMLVVGMLLSASMAVVFSSRRGYDVDRGRIEVNQNLRGSLDLIGLEIRRAGERLPDDFPIIELVDGPSGAPDTLTLRRNLSSSVLPVCQALTSGSVDSELRVAELAPSGLKGCAALPDANADTFPDNIEAWHTIRLARGGSLKAYIYHPLDQAGQWIEFDGAGSTGNDYLSRADSAPWDRDYATSESGRVYVLEQKRYALNGDTLEFSLNDTSTIPISSQIENFQVTITLDDGTVLTAMDATTSWTRVRAVNITLTGRHDIDGQPMRRSIDARFLPRSVLGRS